MQKLLTLVVVSLSMVLASGALAQEPIPIGYVGPLTGSVALLGNEALKGATLAIEQINAAGGVLGRPLKIFAADNKCTPAEAVAADPQGHHPGPGGGLDRPALQLRHAGGHAHLRAGEDPLVVEASTNPQITVRAGAGGNKWVFRPNLPDDINAIVFAKMIVDLGGKNVSFLLTNDDWGRGVGSSFKEVVEKEGGKVVSQDFYEEGETNFLSVLTKIKGLGPNALLIAARTASGAVIMKQYTELGLKVPVFNQGDMVNEQFVKLVGKDIAKGILGSESWYPGVEDPINKKFEADYIARWGYDPIEPAAYGYVGVQVIAEAIRLAKAATPEAIRDGLTRVDLKTIAGQVKFDEHNQAWTWVVVAKVTDEGKIVTVKQVQVNRPAGYWEEWEKKTKK